MLRSMYSAVSGLNTNQTSLDVIGNNISNVNTNGYKSMSTNFSDLLYQTQRAASGASDSTGAISPIQVGLGGRTSSITTNISAQGSALTTNGAFDMMITGSNFFVVQNGDDNYYTRDGSFMVDSDGYLVNSSLGYYVMGWKSGDGSTVDSGGALQRLQLMSEDTKTSNGEATTYLTVSGNIDEYDSQLANGRGIDASVYASDGNQYNLKFTLDDAGDENASTYTLTLTGITDSSGKSIDVTEQEINLVYDASNGKLSSANSSAAGTATITLPADAGGASVTLDFSKSTNYNSSGTSSMSMTRGNADGDMAGRQEGTRSGISVSKAGLITITYTNGDSKVYGQIGTAQFMNAGGLVSEGNNLYSASNASGDPEYVTVDEDGGSISTGVLEASNVDLADEFTRMITAQRAFQANSRVITTSDSMLSELRGLKSS